MLRRHYRAGVATALRSYGVKDAAHVSATPGMDDAFSQVDGAAHALPDVMPESSLAPEGGKDVLDTLAEKSTQGHVGPLTVLRHFLGLG